MALQHHVAERHVGEYETRLQVLQPERRSVVLRLVPGQETRTGDFSQVGSRTRGPEEWKGGRDPGGQGRDGSRSLESRL